MDRRRATRPPAERVLLTSVEYGPFAWLDRPRGRCCARRRLSVLLSSGQIDSRAGVVALVQPERNANGTEAKYNVPIEVYRSNLIFLA